jgi:hypothetical protein
MNTPKSQAAVGSRGFDVFSQEVQKIPLLKGPWNALTAKERARFWSLVQSLMLTTERHFMMRLAIVQADNQDMRQYIALHHGLEVTCDAGVTIL